MIGRNCNVINDTQNNREHLRTVSRAKAAKVGDRLKLETGWPMLVRARTPSVIICTRTHKGRVHGVVIDLKQLKRTSVPIPGIKFDSDDDCEKILKMLTGKTVSMAAYHHIQFCELVPLHVIDLIKQP